ncbi:DUF3040 domain-containing protein [Actinosynnema sp. NPDC059797]
MGWWGTVAATALAVGLLGIGYAGRHRCRAQLLRHREDHSGQRAVHAAVPTERTTMNEHERRRLRAIEQQLEDEDPEFAERLRALDRPDHRQAAGRLTCVVVFGLVLALIGVLADPALVVIGVLIAAPAWGVRLLLPTSPRPHPAPGPDDDPPPGCGRGAPV